MSELTAMYSDLEALRKQLNAAAEQYGDVEAVIPAASVEMVDRLADGFAQLAEDIAAVQAVWVTQQLLDD